ncbi:MAG: 30S ribosomal protein S3 [Patescibacteria group bacterium]
MGQKVNPIAYRLPLSSTTAWKSRWFSTNHKKYIDYLDADLKLRKALMKRLAMAGVARVEIERSLRSMKIIIFVARPGIVIGRGGSGLEELKKFINKTLGVDLKAKNNPKIDMQVEEIKAPDQSAYLVAMKIVEQLEKRIPARRVAVKAMERTMQAQALGIKVLLSGRVNGAEISRRELYKQGSVPLQTLRADVDYAHVPALTRSGYVGVKVWIHRGEKNATT